PETLHHGPSRRQRRTRVETVPRCPPHVRGHRPVDRRPGVAIARNPVRMSRESARSCVDGYNHNFVVDLSLIRPACNEARVIPLAMGRAFCYSASRGLSYESIVAADGTDGTREIVHEMAQRNPALQAIGHDTRGGKGRAIREAVAISTGKIIGYADADNKVP